MSQLPLKLQSLTHLKSVQANQKNITREVEENVLMLSVNGKFLDWECNIGWSEYGMRLPLHGTGWNHQLKYCLPGSTFERACIVVEFISSILFGLSLLFHLSRRTIAYKNIRLNQRCIHRPSSSCLSSCSSPLLLLYLVVGFCQVSLAAQFMPPAIV